MTRLDDLELIELLATTVYWSAASLHERYPSAETRAKLDDAKTRLDWARAGLEAAREALAAERQSLEEEVSGRARRP